MEATMLTIMATTVENRVIMEVVAVEFMAATMQIVVAPEKAAFSVERTEFTMKPLGIIL